MKKYEFTGETINHFGRTLKRIRRLSDGLLGGFIEGEHNLSHYGSCFVYDSAMVYGSAKVYDSAQVCGSAKVYGSAKVCDSAIICDSAQVYGSAILCNSAKVCDSAKVYDSAIICDSAKVSKEFECVNTTGMKYNITLTPTWGHVGCVQFNPMELDSIPYDNRVSEIEFHTIKETIRLQYELMLSKMWGK